MHQGEHKYEPFARRVPHQSVTLSDRATSWYRNVKTFFCPIKSQNNPPTEDTPLANPSTSKFRSCFNFFTCKQCCGEPDATIVVTNSPKTEETEETYAWTPPPVQPISTGFLGRPKTP